MEHSHKFFRNTACKYFPCHRMDDDREFNCLFCYCPLYCLGQECGGDFVMRDGVKDCSACLVPHRPEGYEYIVGRLSRLIKEGKAHGDRKRSG